MSLRLEMLQVARLAPRVLEDSASLVRDFLLRQLDQEGVSLIEPAKVISITRSLASMG